VLTLDCVVGRRAWCSVNWTASAVMVIEYSSRRKLCRPHKGGRSIFEFLQRVKIQMSFVHCLWKREAFGIPSACRKTLVILECLLSIFATFVGRRMDEFLPSLTNKFIVRQVHVVLRWCQHTIAVPVASRLDGILSGVEQTSSSRS